MKQLLLALLLGPGVASANIINVEYWGTVTDDGGAGTLGDPIHGRFEIDTSLAPRGEFQSDGRWAMYTNHGDSPLFKDRSGFITDPDNPLCGCSQDSLFLIDVESPDFSDVFNVANRERRGPDAWIVEELEFQSNDLLHGTSLDQSFGFDQAPTTFGRLLFTKVGGGMSIGIVAVLERVRVWTTPAPNTCRP
jgi:hypothetical protein